MPALGLNFDRLLFDILATVLTGTGTPMRTGVSTTEIIVILDLEPTRSKSNERAHPGLWTLRDPAFHFGGHTCLAGVSRCSVDLPSPDAPQGLEVVTN
jgi:hypothetical protein